MEQDHGLRELDDQIADQVARQWRPAPRRGIELVYRAPWWRRINWALLLNGGFVVLFWALLAMSCLTPR